MPKASASLMRIDNIYLAPAGAEQADTVLDLTPAVSVKGRGRRASLDLNYRLQNIFYKSESGQNTSYHQLDSHGSVELLEDWFHLDAMGAYSQRNTTRDGIVGYGNYSITDNRSNVSEYRVSPYFAHRFGSAADFELRYTRTAIAYDTNTVPGIRTNGVDLAVRSGTRFERLSWALRVDRQNVETDDRSQIRFEQSEAQLRYQLKPAVGLLLIGGYEYNEFQRIAPDEEPAGAFWRAGFVWTPSSRTSLQVTAGSRFYGDSVELAFMHTSRRSTWHATYSESLTTGIQAASTGYLFDAEGNPIFDAEGNPIYLPGSVPLTSEVFLRKHFSTDVTISGRRSVVTLVVFNDLRLFQESGNEERGYGTSLAWKRKLSRIGEVNLNGDWRREDLADISRVDEYSNVALELTRRLAGKATGTLAFRRMARRSDQPGNDYQQNTIAATVNINF